MAFTKTGGPASDSHIEFVELPAPQPPSPATTAPSSGPTPLTPPQPAPSSAHGDEATED